jgi:hypothetical protein
MEAEVSCRSRSESLTRWIGNCTCRLHALCRRAGRAGGLAQVNVEGLRPCPHLPHRGCHGPVQPGPRCHRPRVQRLWRLGKGFVPAINRRWAEPEAAYRGWARSGQEFGLGMVQLVTVEEQLRVANMVAQHGYVSRANPVAIRYGALSRCLSKLWTVYGRLRKICTVLIKGGIGSRGGRNVRAPCDPESGCPVPGPRVRPESRAGPASDLGLANDGPTPPGRVPCKQAHRAGPRYRPRTRRPVSGPRHLIERDSGSTDRDVARAAFIREASPARAAASTRPAGNRGARAAARR